MNKKQGMLNREYGFIKLKFSIGGITFNYPLPFHPSKSIFPGIPDIKHRDRAHK